MPAQIGLYAVPLALVGYALFGGSRLLVFAAAGSVAAVSAGVGTVLHPHGQSMSVTLTAALALRSCPAVGFPRGSLRRPRGQTLAPTHRFRSAGHSVTIRRPTTRPSATPSSAILQTPTARHACSRRSTRAATEPSFSWPIAAGDPTSQDALRWCREISAQPAAERKTKRTSNVAMTRAQLVRTTTRSSVVIQQRVQASAVPSRTIGAA